MKVPGQALCSLGEDEPVSINTIDMRNVQESLDNLSPEGLTGPVLEMLPHGAKFDEPTEVSLDINNLISEAQVMTR